MNRSALKKYAPQARLDFIEAVTLRARRLGLDPSLPVGIEQTGDVLLIGGQPFPASIAKQRSDLARRVQQQGFTAVVEALAYTWFNRLVAIRFMELKGYLSHGYRVLSHPLGQQPEILDHVQHLDLPGLDKAEVIRLKTAGNQDEALYREILLAQCHELHRNMPFLFEALDDATELLLPDNLLRTDSPIAHLVSDIEEADWHEVEVIGWLYQFYISDKKDEVIGKVVKSEDIPAATQLFTPNWIVQYLVQNSLGRLWLMANPGSSLKEKMPYYIEPAEQAPEVQAQLDALIKVRMDEDGGTLNPETLTLLDPACGSGHILVEAYNLLRAIYEERGYRSREIPRLILQKNLFGLDIDDRAAQLAGFALLMKAREDDRRLFDDEGNPPNLNVMAIQQSAGLPDAEIAQVIIDAAIQLEGGEAFHSGQLFGGGQLETQHSSGLTVLDLRQLIQLFEHGKTFGSLISVPDTLKVKLGKIVDLLANVRSCGDDLSRIYACQILDQFALPASMLGLKYDVVVANPPYMGAKNMPNVLKSFASKKYPESKADLYAMFTSRSLQLARSGVGASSLVTMQGWMFLSSFESLRNKLVSGAWISSLTQIGYNSFPELNSKVVQACAFVLMNFHAKKVRGVYVDLNSAPQSADKREVYLSRGENEVFVVEQDGFSKIDGSPISYWVSDSVVSLFDNKKIKDGFQIREGLGTRDDALFMRYIWEVDSSQIRQSGEGSEKWIKADKAGQFRRWFGNQIYLLNWEHDGYAIKNHRNPDGSLKSRPQNTQYFFKEAVSWGKVGSGLTSFRYRDASGGFTDAAPSIFGDNVKSIIGLLNSKVFARLLEIQGGTLNVTLGMVGGLPIVESSIEERTVEVVDRAIELSMADWNELEYSDGFMANSLVSMVSDVGTMEDSWLQWSGEAERRVEELVALEKANNKHYIEFYGLQKELSCDVAIDQIMFARAERGKDTQSLVSYAIGCMMGRYSLDESGLIFANSRGVGFNSDRYSLFPADIDGIIPVTDEPWFEDDASERVREFVKVVWGDNTLVENMEWLADSLGRKSGESAEEAVRGYLSASFFKDHLKTYKKRPIYWLFSSGKQKAFECLVYLHRYNEGTLSRMRMEYVVPLQSRMQARIDKLADDINSATSSVQQNALQKRKDKLTKQLEELRRFDENLRPYADQRITLDLDDGVKVNYGKFGDLLADVKVITGGKED